MVGEIIEVLTVGSRKPIVSGVEIRSILHLCVSICQRQCQMLSLKPGIRRNRGMARNQVKQMSVLAYSWCGHEEQELLRERMKMVSHQVLVLGETTEKPPTVTVQVEGFEIF